jgi:uncharacterized protein
MVKAFTLIIASTVMISPFFQTDVFGSDASDIAFLCSLPNISQKNEEKEHVFFFPKYEESELRMLAYLIIGCYQNFISSQQYNICAFEPSCSHYGQRAVNKYGFIRGLIVTADRLERCNPYAVTYGYSMDPVTNKLIDPVVDFSSEKRTVP